MAVGVDVLPLQVPCALWGTVLTWLPRVPCTLWGTVLTWWPRLPCALWGTDFGVSCAGWPGGLRCAIAPALGWQPWLPCTLWGTVLVVVV